MNYVEWLRVRNCLRITFIVLGVLVVLAVIVRISFFRYPSYEALIAHMATERGTSERHVTLADGTKRMILDNPGDRMHIVVDDRGSGGRHIVITEPSTQAHERAHVEMGSMEVRESRHGTVTTTIIDTNGAVPMLIYMGFADVVALIVATVLAAPFAREIDGHLEVALTKPIPRAGYAIGVIGADVAGILAALFATLIVLYICALFFEAPKIDFSGSNAHALPMGIAMSLAWYTLLAAATAWAGRGYGAVLGFAWPVVLIVNGLAKVEPTSVLGAIVHYSAWVIAQLNPLWHADWSGIHESSASSAPDLSFGLRLAINVLLFAVYAALAVWRWQRVEA